MKCGDCSFCKYDNSIKEFVCSIGSESSVVFVDHEWQNVCGNYEKKPDLECVEVRKNHKKYPKEDCERVISSFLRTYEELDDLWEALERFPCESTEIGRMLKGDLIEQLADAKLQPDGVEDPYPLILFKTEPEVYLELFRKLCIYHHYHGVFQRNTEIKHYDVFFDSVSQLLKFMKKN